VKISSLAIIASILFAFALGASTASSGQTFKELYSFCSQSGCTDGSNPYSTLVQGTDGAFYGTTTDGISNGIPGYGTIFKIGAGGHLTTLYTFCSLTNCADGSYPQAGLVQGTDGNFYGAALFGGSYANCSNGCGTIFRITPERELTTLYTFCSHGNCPDGGLPVGTLFQASDGNFYGTTTIGGTGGEPLRCASGCGTVFRVTPTGRLTVLHSFCSQPSCADGATPYGGVIQAADGNLYGTTYAGGNTSNTCAYGSFGCGTVFGITLSGKLTTLYSFCSQPNCSDGYFPYYGSLVQGSDGNLYGTTLGGGSENAGTAFEISMDGVFKTVYTFCSQENCADGSVPFSGLIQGTDGNLYGLNWDGGAHQHGTAFQLTTAGVLTTLYSFCSQPSCADGANPVGSLFQATNGSLYGTTFGGGQNQTCGDSDSGCGTVFSISEGLRPFVKTVPASGKAGDNVFILGNNLTSATAVTFNGTAATFAVESNTAIEATVPADATSGFIRVTTAKKILKSNVAFRIIP
jgi:uncharacterized repeat protein (TIGR03803 family)